MVFMNWKIISASDGYRSLKQAYVDDVQDAQKSIRRGHRPMRDRAEFLRYFRKAIGLAMKYSSKWGIPIIDVLNHWESERDYWWISFYQTSNLSRRKPNL